MKHLSHWSIVSRLFLSFGLVIAFCILGISFSLYHARVAADATRDMMESPLTKERVASDWYTITYGSVVRNTLIARSSDDTLTAAFASQAAEDVKTVTGLLKKLNEMDPSEKEKEILQSIADLRGVYLGHRDQLFKLRKEGDLPTVKAFFENTFTPSANAYKARVRDFKAYQSLQIDTMAKAIESNNQRSFTLSVILCVLIVSFASICAYLVSRAITVPLKKAIDVAKTVASGDLTTSFEAQPDHEIGALMSALSDMNASLRNLVQEAQSGAHSISIASSEIAAGNLDLSSRTEEQAASLEETASSMEELTKIVKQNESNALQAHQLSKEASQVATDGGAIVSEVVSTMGSIDAASRKIADIISVIDGIAFQTNILALNAAVEAARAGEQGRGFAVVATEVRNLAHRSAAAAKEIKGLIDQSTEQVNAGSVLVKKAGSTMTQVVQSVHRVTSIMNEISSASHDQTTGIEQVNHSINQMDSVTQQNAALVEEAAAAAASLNEQAQHLTAVAGQFNLGHAAPSRVTAPSDFQDVRGVQKSVSRLR